MISRWLSTLGGADESVLKHAPSDRAKFSSLGGIMLGTGALAAVSAMYALIQSVRLPWPYALGVGIGWGMLIIALDRQLIITMTRQSAWRNVLTALPRLLLAVLLGFVISTPLVLQIFDPEIQQQISVAQAQAANEITGAGAAGQAAAPDRIDQLQGRIDELQNPELDPAVQDLVRRIAEQQAEVDRLSVQVGCEVGTGAEACDPGTIAGEGPVFRENSRQLGEARTRLTDLQQQLGTARAEAQAAVDAQNTDPNSELNSTRTELEALVTARGQQLTSNQKNTGISARLTALAAAGEANRVVAIAHYVLIAMFAAIEILPVLAKLMSLWGPPTLYERLTQKREEQILDHGGDPDRHELDEVRRQTRLDMEKQRAAAQLEASAETTEQVVRTQQEIAGQAIEQWRQVVLARSQDELAAWYEEHRHTGRRASRGTPTVRQRRAAEFAEEPIHRSPAPAQREAHTSVEAGDPAERDNGTGIREPVRDAAVNGARRRAEADVRVPAAPSNPASAWREDDWDDWSDQPNPDAGRRSRDTSRFDDNEF